MPQKAFSQADLEEIYRRHQEWLNDKKVGKQACYKGILFERLDFSSMNFEQAIFENCSFKDSHFAKSSFKNADLSFSDFSESYHIIENCFSSANLTGCNFGDKKIFTCNNIKRYEDQYMSYQKVYVYSFIFSLILFLFPSFFYKLSINFFDITVSIPKDCIPYAVIASSFLSCLMSFYFLKINAKNLTEQFMKLPRVFPNGEKRENKINNSFLKSIFDIQNDENDEKINDKNISYLQKDFNNTIKSVICVEHNIVFFSLSIFFMEISNVVNDDLSFFIQLMLLPFLFSKYRAEHFYLYSVFASTSCWLFIFYHNYFLSFLFFLLSLLCYPSGKFNSRIILLLYMAFVLRVVYTYSLFPKENFFVQGYNETCNMENYNVSKVIGRNFDRMDLKRLQAVSINFSNKIFDNSDLSGSDLRCSIFKNTSFHNSILDNVDFRGAYIEDYDAICEAKSYKNVKTDKPVFCINVPISR